MTIKLLASFLLVVSAYVGWWAVSAASLLWLFPAVVSLVAAIGLFLNKPWSQYLWHFIALIASLSWLASVVRVALSGSFVRFLSRHEVLITPRKIGSNSALHLAVDVDTITTCELLSTQLSATRRYLNVG